MLQDLKEEYLDAPTEISSGSRAQQILSHAQKEKQEYEETYLMRLPVTKAEKHRQRKLTTLGKCQLPSSFNNQLTFSFRRNTGRRDPRGDQSGIENAWRRQQKAKTGQEGPGQEACWKKAKVPLIATTKYMKAVIYIFLNFCSKNYALNYILFILDQRFYLYFVLKKPGLIFHCTMLSFSIKIKVFLYFQR